MYVTEKFLQSSCEAMGLFLLFPSETEAAVFSFCFAVGETLHILMCVHADFMRLYVSFTCVWIHECVCLFCVTQVFQLILELVTEHQYDVEIMC